MKKAIALILSVVMMLALAVIPAFATVAPNTGTITINLPSQEIAPTASTTYTLYKVFDATVGANGNISYKRLAGSESVALPTGFSVDTAGNVTHAGTATALTDTEIAAIAAYISAMQAAGVTVPTTTATAAAGATSVDATVPYGYYYITTTNGSVVTVDSTTPNATVNDKNFIPKVVKSAGTEYNDAAKKAIAQVGTDQPFTAKVTVGKGTTKLVFTDTMTNMTYNSDAKVYVGGNEVTAAADKFTVEAITGGFKITFVDAYIASLITDTVTSADIVIKYSGKVTSDALSTNPAENTATITSGDNGNSSSDVVKVYNAKFTVTKEDGSNAALAGAGFIVSRTSVVNNANVTEYYKLANGVVTWVTNKADATMYVSGDDGAVTAFTGLGAGVYTLIEEQVPNGYNKAADLEFTISNSDYTTTNLEQTATVINNEGVELPSTGGIGTKIFIALGSVIAVAASVIIVTNKRAKKEEI